MPPNNCPFRSALSFLAFLLVLPTLCRAQPPVAPADPNGFKEPAIQEADGFHLSPNARQAADIIGVEPRLKRLSSLAASGMSLEELSLRQQITEAVVVASLDLDSVVDGHRQRACANR
jgi:hypothetical protein